MNIDPVIKKQWQELAELKTDDPEVAKLADAERQKLKDDILARFKSDETPAILEIRPGTGGQEAALFAAALLRMYMKYAEKNDWRTEILNLDESPLGGIESTTAVIRGPGAGPLLRAEAGVHRVQRVPKTEKSGRIHTSTASVVVMPEASAGEITVKPEDIRFDVFRASGKGGQGVNTTDSAVRVTHRPTGLVVTCQDERSQLKNKDRALRVLRSRLKQIEDDKTATARGQLRQSMIGQSDRSDKMRTYNFVQDRLTDHRLGQSWHGLERILAGNLDEVVEALQTAELEASLQSTPR